MIFVSRADQAKSVIFHVALILIDLQFQKVSDTNYY
jgi:hypothetical protein